MSTAAAIRQMLAAGLTVEQALIAVEAMEQHAPVPAAPVPVVVERSVGASAIRMRRLRHKTSQVTDSVTSDVTVTKKERSPEPSKEKTTPLPQTPSVSESSPVSEKPCKPKRASRIGPDWLPSERNRADAIEAGVPPAMIDRMGHGFRDYWVAKAGKDGAKLDWDATWRNWCRREAEKRGWAPALQQEDLPSGQQPDGSFHHMQDTPEYEAWAEATGKRMADTKGGWRFPSRWPPGYSPEARQQAPPVSSDELFG